MPICRIGFTFRSTPLQKVVGELKLLDEERTFERIAMDGVPETLDDLQKTLSDSSAQKVIGAVLRY